MSTLATDWPRCACGCGDPVPARGPKEKNAGQPRKYIHGHNATGMRKGPARRCECGEQMDWDKAKQEWACHCGRTRSRWKAMPETERQRMRVRTSRRRNDRKVQFRYWIAAIKAHVGCEKCGLKSPEHPFVFEFHHQRGTKLFNIAEFCNGAAGHSIETFVAEIEKCGLLCANCHRTEHFGHGHRPKRHLGGSRYRYWLDQIKSQLPCEDCGGRFEPAALDFHHARGKKLHQITLFCTAKCSLALDIFLAELAKCDLVCCNCHRIRHWGT